MAGLQCGPRLLYRVYCLGTQCSAHMALGCQFWLNKLYPSDMHRYDPCAPHGTGGKKRKDASALHSASDATLVVGMAWNKADQRGDPRHSAQDCHTENSFSAEATGCNRALCWKIDAHSPPPSKNRTNTGLVLHVRILKL